MILRAFGLAAALSTATPALAQTLASFVVANDDGYGVDACFDGAGTCAQPVATAWCVANGYDHPVEVRRAAAGDVTGSIGTAVAAPAGIVITCAK